MSGYALGLIETKGKLAAIEAADVALKAANVTLCGVENATGALITVKIEGDVGAVKAAVEAARARAMLLSAFVSTHVIPRPAEAVRGLIAKPAPAKTPGPRPLPVPDKPAGDAPAPASEVKSARIDFELNNTEAEQVKDPELNEVEKIKDPDPVDSPDKLEASPSRSAKKKRQRR